MLNPLYDAKKEKELINTIDNITQAIKDDENNPKHYFARALEYYQLSQQYYDIFESFDFIGNEELYYKYVNKAYDDIDKALSFNQPLDDYAYSFKLFMLKKLKRWDDLIEYGIKLEESVGLTTEDCALIGEAFFHLENWQDCVDCYTAVIEEFGEKDASNIGIDIFIERGIAYSELEQYELAINDYKKHIELKENVELCKYNIYGLMADAYEELEDYEQAISAYSNLLKIYEENVAGLFRRGRLYCDFIHNYTLAVEDFEKAISISQDNRLCYSFCAYAYVHKGEHDEANDKALALYDYEKAIEYYKIAHKMEFGDKDSQDAKNSYRATVGFAMLKKEELSKEKFKLC